MKIEKLFDIKRQTQIHMLTKHQIKIQIYSSYTAIAGRYFVNRVKHVLQIHIILNSSGWFTMKILPKNAPSLSILPCVSHPSPSLLFSSWYFTLDWFPSCGLLVVIFHPQQWQLLEVSFALLPFTCCLISFSTALQTLLGFSQSNFVVRNAENMPRV